MAERGTEHWIATDRGRLFARVWVPNARRDGPPILLFHDSLGCVALWRDFPARLAESAGRTVVAYDRLGFGQSDPYPGAQPFSFVHDEAATVGALRESLGTLLDTFVALGHSVGGGMAVATAARFPHACVALVTESAQSFVEERTLDGVRVAREAFARPGEVERLARYHGDKARWVLHAWLDTWLDPAFADWSLDDDARRVRCPTLALHGDRDEYGSLRHPERIARLTVGPSRVVALDGCGHVPHREQPARVLDEVVRFLDAVPNDA